MFRFLSFVPFLLFLFPFLELYLFFRWVEESPGAALTYMAATMGLGALCIKFAKVGFSEFSRRLRDGVNIRAALTFAKFWLIGALLFFPGYLTDVIAVLIALVFSRKSADPPQKEEGDIVEAEGRFVDEGDDKLR